MIKRNHHYILKAKPMNSKIKLSDFQEHFNDIKDAFNTHKVHHPKEIDSIKMDEKENNVLVIDLWTEKPLSEGRELQGARRVSEALASYDKTLVVPKSRVLISV